MHFSKRFTFCSFIKHLCPELKEFEKLITSQNKHIITERNEKIFFYLKYVFKLFYKNNLIKAL